MLFKFIHFEAGCLYLVNTQKVKINQSLCNCGIFKRFSHQVKVQKEMITHAEMSHVKRLRLLKYDSNGSVPTHNGPRQFCCISIGFLD